MHATRRNFVGSLAAAVPAPGAARRRTGRHPNVLVIIVDQWSGVVSELDGRHPMLRTPAVASLAAGGARFQNSYCTYPLCSPSRASLITGRMPHQVGVMANLRPDAGVVPASTPTLGEVFAAAGYDTGYFGKEHIGGAGYRGIGERGSVQFARGGYLADGCMLDPVFIRDAIEFIRRRRNRPFLVVVSLINPHDICYQPPHASIPVASMADICTAFEFGRGRYLRGLGLPPPPQNLRPAPPTAMRRVSPAQANWGDREWRQYLATYYLLIENLDWLIGRLLEALAASGLKRDTLILFTADHGDQMGAHQLVGKGVFYEESARVPLVIAWENVIKPGQVDTHNLVSGIDVLPTLCDYAGLPAPPGMTGRSLRPLLEGRRSVWRDFIVAETSDGRMVRTGSHKYIAYRRNGDPEFLFDLAADPGETTNLAETPEARPTLENHRRMLAAWMAETGDGFRPRQG